GSSRPSTSFLSPIKKDVDARDKPGHDGEIGDTRSHNPKYAFRTSGLPLMSLAAPCINTRPVWRM
ncbi:MAG: hypothetical protein QOF22_167, partial [Bradyrhizobium sp.]|nr:hypothetical protein [Bradyrhizobium sp.]